MFRENQIVRHPEYGVGYVQSIQCKGTCITVKFVPEGRIQSSNGRVRFDACAYDRMSVIGTVKKLKSV